MPSNKPCACTTLRRATRAVTAAYDKALEPSGLRITQFSVLRTLARRGPLPVTKLAHSVALERSTMGRNLDPLERRGLVKLATGGSDGRERVVQLTDAGMAAVTAALPAWHKMQARIGSLVSHEAIQTLAEEASRLTSQS